MDDYTDALNAVDNLMANELDIAVEDLQLLAAIAGPEVEHLRKTIANGLLKLFTEKLSAIAAEYSAKVTQLNLPLGDNMHESEMCCTESKIVVK